MIQKEKIRRYFDWRKSKLKQLGEEVKCSISNKAIELRNQYNDRSRGFREDRLSLRKTENFVKNLELDETLGQLLVAEVFQQLWHKR